MSSNAVKMPSCGCCLSEYHTQSIILFLSVTQSICSDMGKTVRFQHPVLLLPACIFCIFLAQGDAKVTLYSYIHWFKNL